MAIDYTWGSTHLKRNEIFSAQMKDLLQDELMASQWVNWISEIPGDSIRTELKINSVGDLPLDDWEESKELPDRRMDTGQFTFQINEFKGVRVPFTDHFFETSFQANEILSKTPVKMKRALDEYLETQILALGNTQTLNNKNTINSFHHRLVGSGDGTTAPTNSLTLQDFSYASLSMKKANVPMSNLIAIVDPVTAHNLNVKSNIVDVSNNPMWEGVVTSGLLDSTGMRFVRNIYGFDVYVSNYLPTNAADEATLTTYDGTAVGSTAGYVTNILMSVADSDIKPFMGAWGRTPKITSWRDEGLETEYHQLTASFGLKLYRPESLITVLTNPAGIA